MRGSPTPGAARLVVAVLALLTCLSARAEVSNAAVGKAIDKAKAYLYAQQKDGTWELGPPGKYAVNNNPADGQWGGRTALVTYALLAAGESPQDPRLAKAIDFLKKADVRGTYALAMRLQVWLLLPPTKEVQGMAKVDAQNLLALTKSEGSARGMHDYGASGPGAGAKNTGYSHSRAQYAVLGLWAAEQLGLEVPGRYWQVAEEGWLDHQDRTGGWTYRRMGETEHALTAGMTAAGVATLFITQDYVHAKDAVDCRGNQANPALAAIDKGVEWLTKNFDKVATDKRYARDFPFATLYAVERVGVAGGLKYFGTHDWYEKGATWLVKVQKADGSWSSGGGEGMGSYFSPVVETPFALLFLVRGRAPVAFAKLDYTGAAEPGKPALWNQRPRDVANLTRWTALSLERDLNWQVVNLKVDPAELLDAPVLYVSGGQPLALSDEHAAKLRAFVDMGGLIVGHADCSNPALANSFRKLGEKLFPAYEFRELPADHVVYNNNFKYANWKIKPQVQGLSNGSRELMLLIHGGDPARFWQVRAVKAHEEAWQLGASIFLYVSDRGTDLRYKGETHVVRADSKVTPNRKLAVARLQYPGNWDPEPGGWRRLTAVMHNEHKLAVEVQPVRPGEGKLKADAFKVAHLTGTTQFKLDDAALNELRQYVAGGGLLVVDAAGGSGDFAMSAEALFRGLYPSVQPRLLPADRALYQQRVKDGATQPLPIAYRPFAKRVLTGSLRTGRLMGADVNDRLAILYSREDLSTGLVGQSVDGVIGYAPQTATALMANVLLSVAPKLPAGTTAPAGTTKPATKTPPSKPKDPKPSGGAKKGATPKK